MIPPHSLTTVMSTFQRCYACEEVVSSHGLRRVCRIRDRVTGERMALKGWISPSEAWPEAVLREASLLGRLRHPALLPPRGYAILPDPARRERAPFFAFQQHWVTGPSLRTLLQPRNLLAVRRWLLQALDLLAWLHRQGLTRLDLTPDHFVQEGQQWKLVDLDQAELDDPFAWGQAHGSLPYLAPECLRNDTPRIWNGGTGGPPSDLFSLGAILAELLSGQPLLLKGDRRESLLAWLMQRPPPTFPPWVETEAADLAHLARRLLEPSPHCRPPGAWSILKELTEAPDRLAMPLTPLPAPSLPAPSLPAPSLPAPSLPAPSLPAPLQESTQELASLVRRLAPGRPERLERGGGLVLRAPAGSGRSTWLQHTLDQLQQAGVPGLLLSAQELASSGELLERCVRWLTLLQAPLSERDSEACSTCFVPAVLTGSRARAAEHMSARVEHWLQRLSTVLPNDALSPAALDRAVLIDDPASLDDVSQRVLRVLLPSLSGSGLLILLGGAGAESFESPVQGIHGIDLPQLAPEDVRAWADALLGPGALASASGLKQLMMQTRGLPGWVYRRLVKWAILAEASSAAQAFAALSEETRLESATDARPPDGEGEDGTQPSTASLSPFALRAAQAVALRGAPIDDRLLMEVLELSTLEPDRSRLVSEGWLLEVPQAVQGDGGLMLPPMRQQALLTLLPEAEKTLLHGRMAECLEQRMLTPDETVLPGDVVKHFLRSEPRRALPHLPHAVTQHVEALELTRAVALLDEWQSLLRPQDPKRAELMRRSGLLALELGKFEEAQRRFQQALDMPGLRLFAVREKALLARCTAGLGRAHMKRMELVAARDALTTALALAEEAGAACPVQECARWQQWLAWLWGASGQPEAEGLRQMERLLEQSRTRLEMASPEWCDQLLLDLELGLRQEKPVETLRPLLDNALQLAAQQPERDAELRAMTWALLLYDRAGEHARAQQVALRLQQLMKQCFDLEGEMRVCNNLGLLERNAGQFLSAGQHFARAARLAERLGQTSLTLRYEHERVDVLLKAERLERAALQLSETSRLLAQHLDADPSSTLAQELLELRLQLLQGLRVPEGLTSSHTATLDARLEALIAGAHQLEPSYLRLEAIADRMQLALAEGRAQQALRFLAPELLTPTSPETALAWKRLHRLASQAHLLLEGDGAGMAAGLPHDAAPTTAAHEDGLAGSQTTLSAPPPVSAGQETKAQPHRRSDAGQSKPLLAAPEPWLERISRVLERISRVLEVADGEEKLAVRLAELAGEVLGGRGRAYSIGDAQTVIPLTEQQDPVSHTLIQRVCATGEPYYCPDIRYDAFLSQASSLRDMQRPCIMCQPIGVHLGQPLGVVYVDELGSEMADDPDAQRILARVAGMAETLLEAFARRRRQDVQLEQALGWLGSSPGMRKVARQVQLLARSDAPELRILLLGETGVGKYVIAKAIHDRSPWSAHPFVSVNCSAISSGLFESELFGHRKGAFTGAIRDRAGFCELAGEGTLFLDEIGDLPLEQQSKLLSVLSESAFRPVGGSGEKPIPFQAHLICATNLPLETMVKDGRFRADLLNRLATNVCRIPALRERGPDDLRLLICRLLWELLDSAKTTEGLRRFEDHFTPAAQRALLSHSWPGNVRELKNLLWAEPIRQVLKAGHKVDVGLIQEVREQGIMSRPHALTSSQSRVLLPSLSLRELKAETDHWLGLYVRAAVQAQGGDKNAAAGTLKCSRDTVYTYLKEIKEETSLSFLPSPELHTHAADTRHTQR